MPKKNDLVHYFRRYERFKIYSTTSLKLNKLPTTCRKDAFEPFVVIIFHNY